MKDINLAGEFKRSELPGSQFGLRVRRPPQADTKG